jgi:hypothetical protein
VRKFFRCIFILVFGIISLAACSPAGASKNVTVGDALAEYNFSKAGTFEEGLYDGASLRIADGVYRISVESGQSELWWGQWGDTLTDVVIDVDSRQMSEPPETAYGIGCRMSGTTGQAVTIDPSLVITEATQEAAEPEAAAEATAEATTEAEATVEATAEATVESTAEATAEATVQATVEATQAPTEEATAESTEVPASVLSDEFANGNGYLFLIQGARSFAILRSRGRDTVPLVNWTASDKILPAPELNQLRAVCMGDYLAFYVNGEFLADVTDDTYSSGQVALLASGATRLGIVAEFDNLKVSAATPR